MNDQEELNQLMDRFMNDDKLETPPLDFTEKVMSAVHTVQRRKIVYRPLVPKYVIIIVLLCVIAFSVVAIDYGDMNTDIAQYLSGLQDVNLWFSNFFHSVKISNTLSYTIVLTGLMVCIQVFFLKKHFDKRFI